MTWRIRPATAKELEPFQARSGYRVRVTLPADMADGRFAESVEFVATPPAAAERPRSLELQIQGSVDGRVTLFGPKIDSHGVLRLGVLQEGEGVRETMVMKVRDQRPSLVVRRIETEPEFLHVRVNACQGHGAGGRIVSRRGGDPARGPAGQLHGGARRGHSPEDGPPPAAADRVEGRFRQGRGAKVGARDWGLGAGELVRNRKRAATPSSSFILDP